ncbi:endoglucanase, partial [Candidatus Endoriftia persephone str. Guaymas]|nr:endoglucanase [Candidatus Endoriftia persephone str. Guaymas]
GQFGTTDDRRVYIRLAHEMNGDWYPWSARSVGENPADYIAMWRHVHDAATAIGLGREHVQWVWSVNASDHGSYGWIAEDYYPGDA